MLEKVLRGDAGHHLAARTLALLAVELEAMDEGADELVVPGGCRRLKGALHQNVPSLFSPVH
jgi:hypothetical protein